MKLPCILSSAKPSPIAERKTPSPATLRKLDMDEFGRVQNWPDGFFGDALGETREQASRMFARQKAAREQAEQA